MDHRRKAHRSIDSGNAWQKEKTIFDVVNDLKEGDVILKGANALDLAHASSLPSSSATLAEGQWAQPCRLWWDAADG